jgi:hypothetical protein
MSSLFDRAARGIKGSYALAALALCLLVFYAVPALAQDTPPGAPTDQGTLIVLALLPTVMGLIAQAQKTGKFIVWTVPEKVIPYLTFVLGFLGGAGTALAKGADWTHALLAGLAGIGAGAGVGLYFHAHANMTSVATRRALAAAGGPPTGGAPGAIAKAATLGAGGLLAIGVLVAATILTGCKGGLTEAETVIDTAKKDFVRIAPEACTLVEDATAIVDPAAEPTVVYMCDLIDGATGLPKGKVPVRVPADKASAAGLARASR